MNNPPKSIIGFDAAYDAYGVMVYRLAMVYLGRPADAEDITQEVFFRLLYRSPDFHDGEHEKRWLLRVTINLCKNQLGGFWRRQVVPLPEDDAVALKSVTSVAGEYSGSSPNIAPFAQDNPISPPNIPPFTQTYFISSSEVAALADALLHLPERYRIPIHLHYYEGYSVAEAAKILKLGQSAVKMRLKRGRDMLKLELEEDQ